MKNYSRLGVLFILLISSAFMMQEDTVKRLPNKSFLKGEKMKYLLHYGFINIGEAVVTTDKNFHQVEGHDCYKVDVKGKTIGTFSLAYNVDDLWQSYIDAEGIYPRKFHRNIKENKYRKVETTLFDHQSKKAKVRWTTNKKPEKYKEFDIDKYSQDMISGYFFLRTVDFDKYQKNDTIKVDAFFEDTSYDFKVVYLGKDEVKTKLGKFSAYVMQPVMPNTDLFDGKNAIKFWMSNDTNRVPLKIRAKMFLGAIEVEITEYKNQFVHLRRN